MICWQWEKSSYVKTTIGVNFRSLLSNNPLIKNQVATNIKNLTPTNLSQTNKNKFKKKTKKTKKKQTNKQTTSR